MVLNVHTKPQGLLGTGRRGDGGVEVGEEGDYIPILHCHYQNDTCIDMGSDESHLNVSLIVSEG